MCNNESDIHGTYLINISVINYSDDKNVYIFLRNTFRTYKQLQNKLTKQKPEVSLSTRRQFLIAQMLTNYRLVDIEYLT